MTGRIMQARKKEKGQRSYRSIYKERQNYGEKVSMLCSEKSGGENVLMSPRNPNVRL